MKPGIPKGTRDFTTEQVLKRNYIFDIIKDVFTKFGFLPIETPAMENLSTLTGKYGDEGDQLLFKVLNNGDFLSKADEKALEARDSAKLVSSISKRGLRYDLTVPFARFVVMNQNDLAFPFKRYQIQPVWRADRPQKGRYQEFYQCDADVVGSGSLLYEAELMQIFDEVFTKLGIEVTIKINNRKILAGLAEVAGVGDKMVEMTVAIDKLDKIGLEGVEKELLGRGIAEKSVAIIKDMLEEQEPSKWKTLLENSEIGQLGLQEMDTLYQYLDVEKLNNALVFDPTLARGLNYYTGCIFEVAANNVKMGSIASGGRYDDLTGLFGLKDVSGVGISFGAERIYDVMEGLDLFPAVLKEGLKVLFIAFDQASHLYAFKCLEQLRAKGIPSELYPDPVKLKKQMKYANARQVPYVVLVGKEEMDTNQLSLKNMETGEQEKVRMEELIKHFV